jgi:hypothetical protein
LLPARAEPVANTPPHFCVLPVDLNHQKVDLEWPVVFPSAPSPIFVQFPSPSPSYWIDQNRRLIQLSDVFPGYALDDVFNHWVEEPWSSRIVTVNGSHPAVTVISPGDQNFRTIYETPFVVGNEYQWLSGPMIISRSHQTIVLKPGGHPYVVGSNGISPWLSENELLQKGIRGITNLYYAQPLSATVIIDVDGNIHLMTDDGIWENLGSFDPNYFTIMGGNRIAEFYDLPALETVIVAFIQAGQSSPHTIIAVHKNLLNLQNRFSVQVLEPSGWFQKNTIFAFSRTFSNLLRLGGGSYFSPYSYIPHWQIFTLDGYKDIPGGRTNTVVPQADWTGFSQSSLKPLTSIHRDLIEGDNKFFLYDGASIFPIGNSTPDKLGTYPIVYDLPSIGRVLVTSNAGIFELHSDGQLTRLKMPFGTSSPYGVTLADWKEAGIALAETSDGLYEIDKNLKASLVPGGQDFKNTWLIRMDLGDLLPAKEKVVANLSSLYVVVDTALSGPNACQIN